MGLFWYPVTPTGRMWAELSVDDPGYGRLVFSRLDDRHDTGDRYDERGTYAGPRLAELLQATTDLALGLDQRDWVRVRPSRGEPIVIERADAALLLPVLQRAVVLATAGEDRYMRTWVEDLGHREPPLCVYCQEGSEYPSNVTISAWCSEYGHTPYGETYATTWADAQRRHEVYERPHWPPVQVDPPPIAERGLDLP